MIEDYGYLDKDELYDMVIYLEKEEKEARARLNLLEAEIRVKEIEKESTQTFIHNIQEELNSVKKSLEKENA